MDEYKNIQNSINSFKELSKDATKLLKGINSNIQSFAGEWGIRHNDERTNSGALIFPWIEQHPLIQEFVHFMYDNNLIVKFAWTEWQAGRDWFALQDDGKYDKLDIETSLKLLTAIIRNDRFNDGALVRAFEDGSFPKIISKLITI